MKFLKTVLLLNATSCLIFGVIFLLFAEPVNWFLGNPFPWLIPLLGVVLLFNGLHLVLASRRAKPVCPEILYFVAGDFLWVIGTLVLIGLGLVITSTAGALVALLVALMVGSFGVMQVLGFKRICSAS